MALVAPTNKRDDIIRQYKESQYCQQSLKNTLTHILPWLRFQKDLEEMAFDLQMPPDATAKEVYDKIVDRAHELTYTKPACAQFRS